MSLGGSSSARPESSSLENPITFANKFGNSVSSCYRAVQIIGRFINAGRYVFDDLSDSGNLCVGFFPFLLIHVFAHCRYGLGAISRVGTWRINLVLEPR